MDLIERQAAIDLVRDVCSAIMCECESHYDNEVGDEVYEDIREVDAILRCNKRIRKALRNMSSAESEIICCEDCKFNDGIKPIADGRYWCLLHSCYMYFCSDAERKTGGSD